MVFCVIVVLIVFIICRCIISCVYISKCAENRVEMFADPDYERRIRKLEERVDRLEDRK